MKTVLFVATIIVATLSSSADPGDEDPDGISILESVVAGLPAERLDISGDLLVRKKRGVEVRELKFDMMLDWGAVPPEARYTILDGFGSALEQFSVARPNDVEPVIHFATGPDLTPTNAPPAFSSVLDTDFTWTDLALSFLWWDGGKRVGEESVKGRDCYMIDVPVPADIRSQDPRYDHVRLWIDKEIRMLLMAEGRGADEEPLRRMWVRSFKKVNQRWMIKDMEIQSYPTDQRTKLTIREVKEAARS